MAAPLQYTTAAEFDAFELPYEALKGISSPAKDLALQWASRLVAGYIRKRKVLPLVSWGDDIKQVVAELAGYYLMSRRGYKPQSGSNDTIRLRYEDAINWLRDVRTGLVELVDCVDSTQTGVDEAGPLAASDTIVNFNYQTRGGPFSRGGYGCGGGELV